MHTVNFKFNNGDTLRDKVTGLTGIVMVCAEYATGCHHYGILQRELQSGKPAEWQWIDQSMLELVESASVQFKFDKKTISGPYPKGQQL